MGDCALTEESARTPKNYLAVLLSTMAVALSLVAVLRPLGSGSETVNDTQEQQVDSLPPDSMPAQSNTHEVVSGQQFRPTISLPYASAEIPLEELEAECELVSSNLLAVLPDEPMAMHVRAMLSAQLHRTEEATELWQRCIELSPKTEQYYVNLATLALDRGDSELAQATLEKAEQEGLTSHDLSHHMCVALTNLGRLEEVVEVAERALKSFPTSAPHWLLLGQARLQLGDTAEAETDLRKAIELGAKTKTAYFSLFSACLQNGKKDEADEFRKIYMGFNPNQRVDPKERYQKISESEGRQLLVFILSESAMIYERSGLVQNAENLLLRALALGPTNQGMVVRIADFYKSYEQYANERELRKRALELEPGNLLSYLNLAMAHNNCDDAQAAEATIKLAISQAPNSVPAYAAMTDFLMEQKQPQRAQWYIEQALMLEPSPQGLQLLARTLRAQGKESEAQAVEQQLIEMTQLNQSPSSN